MTTRARSARKDGVQSAQDPTRVAIEHGVRIGREPVERLMREANISGMVRRKRGQYVSLAFGPAARAAGIRRSMGSICGRPYGERGRALLRIVRTDQG